MLKHFVVCFMQRFVRSLLSFLALELDPSFQGFSSGTLPLVLLCFLFWSILLILRCDKRFFLMFICGFLNHFCGVQWHFSNILSHFAAQRQTLLWHGWYVLWKLPMFHVFCHIFAEFHSFYSISAAIFDVCQEYCWCFWSF